MRIAFVYPRPFNSHEDKFISHGLCMLSACAKKGGHETFLIDLQSLNNWDEYLALVTQKNPDILAITISTIDYTRAIRAAQLAKEAYPDKIIVTGGIHATLRPEEVASSPFIDYIIRGEGEISFLELIKHLENKETPQRIIDGKRPDLDNLPFADRELFNTHERHYFKNMPSPFITIIASRGCIYSCAFCQPAERLLFGNQVRARSVDNVIEELNILRQKYSFASMLIHDDCLTEYTTWVSDFCRKYKANGFTQPWVCQVRADNVCRHPELIREMRNAGLRAVHIGFESGSQKMLDLMKKGVTVEENYRAYKILKMLGIAMQGMFILGLPGETKKDIAETIRMIKRMKMERPAIAFFTPFPGTVLYDFCKKNDLLTITNYDDYDRAKHTLKIKGIDYVYLLKVCDSTLPLSRKIKNEIKSLLKFFLGIDRARQLIKFIKSF